MLTRSIQPQLLDLLDRYPAVGLLGPRQVGKTTLARIVGDSRPSLYLDLQKPGDRAKLTDAAGYLSAHADQLVILDEVHRMPGLFEVLRGLIDEARRAGRGAGRYLILGSTSVELLRQSAESLAGRIAYIALSGFNPLEVVETPLDRLWLRGGYPESLFAATDRASFEWRADMVTTYLERDIRTYGFRVPSETLRRFWTMLAHAQGTPFNASRLAQSLGLGGASVARYLDLLCDVMLVRRLAPYHANVTKRLVKAPKVYLRDSGFVHALLDLPKLDDVLAHPIAGMSWEGFVIESIIAALGRHTPVFFYRTHAGAEVDLVIQISGRELWTVEIKRGGTPALSRGFHEALADLAPSRAFVVYTGTETYPLGHGPAGQPIHAIPLRALMDEAARASAGD